MVPRRGLRVRANANALASAETPTKHAKASSSPAAAPANSSLQFETRVRPVQNVLVADLQHLESQILQLQSETGLNSEELQNLTSTIEPNTTSVLEEHLQAVQAAAAFRISTFRRRAAEQVTASHNTLDTIDL